MCKIQIYSEERWKSYKIALKSSLRIYAEVKNNSWTIIYIYYIYIYIYVKKLYIYKINKREINDRQECCDWF